MLEHMYLVHGDADHPEPANDDRLDNYIAPDEVCGFPTLDALEDWFAGYEDPLHELGYEISVYSVPFTSVRFGTHQCVFLNADATLSKTLPLLN